jgi:hypothetical protein
LSRSSATPPRLGRRAVLRALAGIALARGPFLTHATARQQAAGLEPWIRRWPWSLDANGDGQIDAEDLDLITSLIGTRRGNGLRPAPGWDPRGDVLAQGRVARAAERAARLGLGLPVPVRPLVACWHYGWYRRATRRGDPVTMRYRGGAYSSSSRATEEEFNRLKGEFGIDVDLLSWIDAPHVMGAYERGYLAARNLRSRRFGLLYEPLLNMGVSGRVEFTDESSYGPKLVSDFAAMGRWLARAAGRGRPAQLDGRPLVYVFASHVFGRHDGELASVGRSLTQARNAFAEAYGALPYLIGDEALFPGDAAAGIDRLYRASYCDAITRYHHYDETQVRAAGGGADLNLDADHRARIAHTERRTATAFAAVRCRFTEAPLLVIPSSAAGFAKRGMPSVKASRDEYAAWLREAQTITDEHVEARHRGRVGTPRLQAPLAIVGSWNEEYEGHAVMPASQNSALRDGSHAGFDWLYAIRSLYGSVQPARSA